MNTEYKERLIMFIVLKNEKLKEKTGIEYINEDDIIDIRHWYESMCKLSYQTIIDLIKNGYRSDISLWCIFFKEDSNECNCVCGYGMRNGFCHEKDSLYQKLYFENENDNFLTYDEYIEIINQIEKTYSIIE